MSYAEQIAGFFKGEIRGDDAALDAASRDASLFEVRPSLVVSPRDTEDVKALVKFAAKRKEAGEDISLTARSAGTDMSGGPLSQGIVVDFLKHFKRIVDISGMQATVQPGVYYRDFEKETLAHDLLLPSYPASRDLCTLGGMVANNSGGEKTLTYGKTEKYVRKIKVVLSDGEEYEVRALTMRELAEVSRRKNLFGEIHRKMFELISGHYEEISAAKPNVTKNSAGYYLWNVYDKEKGIFDLTKIIVGSQGTLGLITEATVSLVTPKKHSSLLIAFLPTLKPLASVTDAVLKFKPESFESFDDHTLKVALKLFPAIVKKLNGTLFSLAFQFLPEFWMAATGGVPKLILIAEFTDDTEEAAAARAAAAREALNPFHLKTKIAKNDAEAKKYWTFRRESFNLLREHLSNLRTAPFIDDFVIRHEDMATFLPRLDAILSRYKLIYTIAGHVGDGNFHIIPLMDLRDRKNVVIMRQLADQVYRLVLDFRGTITGEHNDGIIRTPYLPMMYPPVIIKLFEETKRVFDPLNIFNPGKKVGIDKEYPWRHISRT